MPTPVSYTHLEHQGGVDADFVGPAAEPAPCLEGREILVDPQEGLLERVLGVRPVAQDAQDPVEEEAEMGCHQGPEGIGVPVRGLLDQLLFIHGIGVSCSPPL